MITMVDVARHAGVSVKTVSRVINDEPHVQMKLRNQVRESINILGYVPSASARSLRSTRSYNIHMVFETWTNNFANTIQFGAIRECQQSGYRLVLNLLENEDVTSTEGLNNWIAKLSKQGRPDGVILVPPHSNEAPINRALSEAGIAVARIGPNDLGWGNSVTVEIDDRAAAREATDYLISLGHRRIAFIRGKEDQLATPMRYAGFNEAMNDANIEIEPSLIVPGNFEFEAGIAAAQKLFSMDKPPTAVFAANDDMAAGVLVTAHRMGLSAPEEFSVMGFDDLEIARHMWPALTTVHQPLQEFGAEAVRALVDKAQSGGKDVGSSRRILPYEFIKRPSTGPAKP